MNAPLRLTLVAGLVCAPASALACGGLFCNTAQPVNQAAERILFAHDEGTVHMHVQIVYDGPPTEFGWLLPAPPDVETAVSSEALFQGLDRLYAPRFFLQQQFEDGCAPPPAPQEEAAPGGEVDDGNGGGVQVLSREPVGPYDRAILAADDVEVLRAWLDENGYGIPEDIDARLVPYIEMGAVFVALKLLSDADSGDIVPLRLSFSGSRPSIPITPTAVAAEPDMGIIVHVLGGERAIPLNYRHVLINEATIDWRNGGQNYPDVVSQAVDEAGGFAFVTDYAGPIDELLTDGLRPLSEDELLQWEAAATLGALAEFDFQRLRDPDIQRVLLDAIDLPDVTAEEFLGCPFCYEQHFDRPFDGAAVAARLREEVQPAREHLASLFDRFGYLTRLYSTMSPEEMNRDPIFSFNPSLEDVAAQRTATWRIRCDENGAIDFEGGTIVLEDGRELPLEENQALAIQRENGEQVAGGDAPAAQQVEQMLEEGEPEVIEERGTEAMPDGGPSVGPVDGDAGAGGGAGLGGAAHGGDDGCGCGATDGQPASALWLLLLAAFPLRRRQRG